MAYDNINELIKKYSDDADVQENIVESVQEAVEPMQEPLFTPVQETAATPVRETSSTPVYTSVAAEKQQEPERRRTLPKKKSKAFKRFLLIWLALLMIFGGYVLYYVNGVLKDMQKNSVEQFISDHLAMLTDEQLPKIFKSNEEFDSGNSVENIRKFLNEKQYTIKRSKEEGVYNLYNGDRSVLGVRLEKLESVNKLGIFNYNKWEFVEVIPTADRELFRTEIKASSDYEVLVNGKSVEPVDQISPKGFADAAEYVNIPSINTYVIDHLTAKPEIKITKDGKDVSFEDSEVITITSEYETFDTLAEAGCDFDAIEFAKNWSKFMTADLAGENYGFHTLSPNFIENSEMYKKAWAWATNVDITFTSVHYLKDPPFTEEKASNVVKYSDDAVTVDVHLVKHMHLNNGEDRDDTMNSTLHLIRQNGEWKVVNIRGIAGQ